VNNNKSKNKKRKIQSLFKQEIIKRRLNEEIKIRSILSLKAER